MPAWTTPELCPLWWAPDCDSLSTTTTVSSGRVSWSGASRGQAHDAGPDHDHIGAGRQLCRFRSGGGSHAAILAGHGRSAGAGCHNARRADPQAGVDRRLHRVRPGRRAGGRDRAVRAEDPGRRGHNAGPDPDLPLRHVRAAHRRGVGRHQRQAGRASGRGGGLRRPRRTTLVRCRSAPRRGRAGRVARRPRRRDARSIPGRRPTGPVTTSSPRSVSRWRPRPRSATWPAARWPSRASTRRAPLLAAELVARGAEGDCRRHLGGHRRGGDRPRRARPGAGVGRARPRLRAGARAGDRRAGRGVRGPGRRARRRLEARGRRRRGGRAAWRRGRWCPSGPSRSRPRRWPCCAGPTRSSCPTS